MIYREFGSLGWKVSAVGMGCWNIGGQWGEMTDQQAAEIIHAAYDAGVNLFDVAEAYGNPHGTSELRLGRALKDIRDKVYIVSKIGSWGFRQGEKNTWQRFFRVFRENWKAGIVPTLVFLLVAGIGGRGLIQVWNAAVAGTVSWTIFSASAFLGILVLGTLSVLFPVLSRFENSTVGLLRNTVLLALGNLPRTLALGLLNAGTVYLCIRYVIPLFFLPSLAALIGSLLIEPMFKPFLKSEEDVAM